MLVYFIFNDTFVKNKNAFKALLCSLLYCDFLLASFKNAKVDELKNGVNLNVSLDSNASAMSSLARAFVSIVLDRFAVQFGQFRHRA